MKLLLLTLLVGGGAYGGMVIYRNRGTVAAAPIAASALFEVQRGDLVVTIADTGYLKAKHSLNITPKFKRQGTISWLVEEGAAVAAGDKLVEFDASELETEISETENSLIQYRIELEGATAELGIQERDNVADIEKAQLALEIAELSLERYDKGEAPNQLQRLKLAEEKARSEFDRAAERFDQVPKLAEEGFLTRIQVEEERIRLREAEINKENALRELQLYEVYTARMERTEKQTARKDAERELENALVKTQIKLKEKQARVAQQELKVQTAENRLVVLRTDLAAMTISAEQPGIVHYGDPGQPWYRDEVKVGNTIWNGRTVITLPDLREMQVLVNIHEAEIGKVALGLSAHVTVETDREAVFIGEVSKIAAVASSGDWGEDSQKTFRVEINLPESGTQLRAGTSARAEIIIETLEDVLYVPIHAVISEEGKHFCFCVGLDAKPVERRVEIGTHNAHYVVVKAGLEQGESVLLYDPRQFGGAGGPAAPAAPAADPPAIDEGGSMPNVEGASAAAE